MASTFPPTQAAPPPYARYRRRRRGLVWPLLLITVGVILLLQNLGILSWELWRTLWQLWPLILILIGLDLVLGGFGRGAVAAAVSLLVLLAVLGLALAAALTGWLPPIGPAGPIRTATLTQTLQGATQASVHLQFGAGDFSVGALDTPGDRLAELTFNGPDQSRPRASYRVDNGSAQLSYVTGGRGPFDSRANDTSLLLTPSVPLTLNVQYGASTAHLDLTKLQVSNLQLQMGASTTTVILPATGLTNATIKGGAATLNVEVPQGVAAQIQYEGGLSTLNVDTGRFPEISSGQAGRRSFQSPDYDSAGNRVQLDIQAGVATINVR